MKRWRWVLIRKPDEETDRAAGNGYGVHVGTMQGGDGTGCGYCYSLNVGATFGNGIGLLGTLDGDGYSQLRVGLAEVK